MPCLRRRRLGALVVVAAGNKGNTGNDLGPLYPAAWASVTAPDRDACDGIVAPKTSDVRVNPTDGLVVPVAGLTRHDEPLRNARDQTRTPIEAPGTNVAVWDVQNTQMRPALTGSSMSTAAVAGALATLWAYRPQSAPHQIVDALYDNAVDLAVQADVCHGAPCPNTRRLSLCAALNAVCQQSNSLCGSYAETCALRAAGSDFAPTGRPAVDVDVDHAITSITLDGTYTNCHSAIVSYSTAVNANPDEVCFDGIAGRRARPWVTPQPGPNSCDICALNGFDLHIRFDPTKGIYQAVDAVVFLTDGSIIKGYDLSAMGGGLASMTAGDTYYVDLQHTLPTVKEGWINYTVNGTFETDDILIY